MEQPQSHSGMVWYNYGTTVDGMIASTSPVSVEIGNDIARQLNQVQIQYGNFTAVPSQSQHIIVAHQPPSDTSGTITLSSSRDTDEIHEFQIHAVPARTQKTKIRGTMGVRVPCPQCGKTYSCNANLRDHIRLHTGERPFECSECGMTFAQRSNWRLHKRVHTGEKPYMCGICGKTFSRSSHLPGHMRVHTGERPFICENCNLSFTSAQALKNHVRTHTGEKPFVCEHCQTPFTHSSSLSSHKKRCNGEKRKRGRPLGSGRRTLKKKNACRPRGRPKKRGRVLKKVVKRSKRDVRFNDEGKTDSESDNIREISIVSKSSISSIVPQKLEDDLMEISVEVFNPSLDKTNDNSSDMLTNEFMKQNESEGISILPDNGDAVEHKLIVTEDMVRVAASAAGLDESVSLHQEAAVTMATLRHGALNLVHHNVCDDNFSQTHTQATFYAK